MLIFWGKDHQGKEWGGLIASQCQRDQLARLRGTQFKSKSGPSLFLPSQYSTDIIFPGRQIHFKDIELHGPLNLKHYQSHNGIYFKLQFNQYIHGKMFLLSFISIYVSTYDAIKGCESQKTLYSFINEYDVNNFHKNPEKIAILTVCTDRCTRQRWFLFHQFQLPQ